MRLYPVTWERVDSVDAPDYSAALAASAATLVNEIGDAVGADPVDGSRALQILESLGFRFHIRQHAQLDDTAPAEPAAAAS